MPVRKIDPARGPAVEHNRWASVINQVRGQQRGKERTADTVRISGWYFAPRATRASAIYALGPEPDAEKPEWGDKASLGPAPVKCVPSRERPVWRMGVLCMLGFGEAEYKAGKARMGRGVGPYAG